METQLKNMTSKLKDTEDTLYEILAEKEILGSNQQPKNTQTSSQKIHYLNKSDKPSKINSNHSTFLMNLQTTGIPNNNISHSSVRNNHNKVFEKYANQCELCEFSTPKSVGVAIHRTKIHGCKHVDIYGKKCGNINCKIHVLLFDPKNPGLKEDKPFKCDHCISSFDSQRGVDTHKGMMHRCLFRDDCNRRCEQFNCKDHIQEYLYFTKN